MGSHNYLDEYAAKEQEELDNQLDNKSKEQFNKMFSAKMKFTHEERLFLMEIAREVKDYMVMFKMLKRISSSRL